MSSIVAALTAIATTDVTLTLGTTALHFRVRAIRSADLVSARNAAVLFAAAPEPVEPVNELDAAIERELRGKLKPPEQSPEERAQFVRFADTVICAGTLAASSDGTTWEPLRIVLTEAEANDGALWVANLPPAADLLIYAAIMKVSTSGGAAGERLASFLGRSTPAP